MRLTMSAFPVLAHCLYFTRDDCPRPTVYDDNPDAAKGNLAHHAIALFGNTPPTTPEQSDQFDGLARTYGLTEDEDIEQVWRWVMSWYDHPISRGPWAHEQAVAYDVLTGEARLLDVVGRNYGDLAPTEIPGTCDRIRTAEDEVVILDNKFGFQRNLTPVEQNRQLRGYALAFSRVFLRSTARVMLAVTNDEGTTVTEHVLHSWDLEELADELRELPARIPESKPVPGLHCVDKYCPARATCPATLQAMALVAPPKEPATEQLTIVIESHEQIANGLPRIAMAEAFIESWRAAAKQYVRQNGPAPLPDGRVWGEHPADYEDIVTEGRDGQEAVALLNERGFGDAVKTKVAVTKKDMEGCLRLHGKPIKAGMTEVFAELRSKGLTRKYSVPRFEAFKPRLPPKAKAS